MWQNESGFVEAVRFINKHNRAPPTLGLNAGLLHGFTNLLDAAQHRRAVMKCASKLCMSRTMVVLPRRAGAPQDATCAAGRAQGHAQRFVTIASRCCWPNHLALGF
jgi:hypothetical protein